ncbi:hypothetical protein NE237_019000 [Protea cynaroides]|uniref:Uncharacterized protein n=1 Tax=Protea cynaroides TaxID=273540 RepID=A0A9Q0KAY3_9MAGN|nr:hypothetical protein NE237_019000 [Protea cynaroides]
MEEGTEKKVSADRRAVVLQRLPQTQKLLQGSKQASFTVRGAPRSTMSLACLVCHSVESPSQSFRSYSVSSDNEGRCSIIINCLNTKTSLGPEAPSSMITSSKVTPYPTMANSQGITGTPRLVRSRAIRRDIVRDWNFDATAMER